MEIDILDKYAYRDICDPVGVLELKELGTIKKEKIDWLGNAVFSGGMLLLLVGITFGAFQVIDQVKNLFSYFGGLCPTNLVLLCGEKSVKTNV